MDEREVISSIEWVLFGSMLVVTLGVLAIAVRRRRRPAGLPTPPAAFIWVAAAITVGSLNSALRYPPVWSRWLLAVQGAALLLALASLFAKVRSRRRRTASSDRPGDPPS